MKCPGCSARLEPGAVICLQCGADLRSGRRLDTRSLSGRDEAETGPNLALRSLELLGEWLPGLLSPGVFVVSLIVAAIGLGILGLCVFFLALGALFTAVLTGGVGLIVYAHAVSFILTGEVNFLQETLLEVSGAKWLLFIALAAAPIVAAFLTLKYGVQ